MELKSVKPEFEDGTLACVCRTWGDESYCFYTAMMNGTVVALMGQGDKTHSTNYLTWSELESDMQLALHRNATERETILELTSFVIEDRSEVFISRCLLVDRETIVQRSNYLGFIEAFYYGGVCLSSKILTEARIEAEKLAGFGIQWRRNWGDRYWHPM